MQIPAKAEYAIRALLTLAASDVSVSADHLAHEQDLPAKFLGAILSDLRRGGLVTSQRGPEGGFKLARDPDQIMIADILRVVSGPMAGVRGMRPETLAYEGEAKHLRATRTLGLPESYESNPYRRCVPRQSRTRRLGVGRGHQ